MTGGDDAGRKREDNRGQKGEDNYRWKEGDSK
jgi:hypothetical protein